MKKTKKAKETYNLLQENKKLWCPRRRRRSDQVDSGHWQWEVATFQTDEPSSQQLWQSKIGGEEKYLSTLLTADFYFSFCLSAGQGKLICRRHHRHFQQQNQQQQNILKWVKMTCQLPKEKQREHERLTELPPRAIKEQKFGQWDAQIR